MMEWTLVTGGGKRLGAELCLYLAQQGLPVLVHYRTSCTEAQEVVNACRAKGVAAELIQGDFSSPEKLEDFIVRCRRQFPAIKNLVNNVGNYLIKAASETDLSEWMEIFQVNLHAPFALSKAFLSSLKQHRGSIINIGVTGAGGMHTDTRRAAYRMSKMALVMLTKTLARELAKDQVRVNMVSPGYLDNAVDLPEPQSLPMRRPARLEEVARVVWFLLQDNSEYITGQNIEVAGGVAI